MYNAILDKLPYRSSFRFVDHITQLDSMGITGDFTLREDAFFYQDHFVGNPITPGVILTEIMAQIGLVAFGIYLLSERQNNATTNEQVWPLLTSTEVSFHRMVLPGQRVTVTSQKEYFRFNKLKCTVQMFNDGNELVAGGTFAGVIGTINIKN